MKKKLLGVSVCLFICFLSTSVFATPVDFTINAGGFGYETGWSITQINGGSWYHGMTTGTMGSNVEYDFDWDLTPGDYRLLMNDTFGDGLDNGGYVYLAVDDNIILNIIGNVFSYNYTLDFTVGESDVVPEPTTAILLCLGLIGLAGVSRKQK